MALPMVERWVVCWAARWAARSAELWVECWGGWTVGRMDASTAAHSAVRWAVY